MNREPVNPDDPQMSAYALGEMSAAEVAEFEARLAESPAARRELAELREVMALLGEGLRGEWMAATERPALRLLEPVASSPAETIVGNVVPGVFRPARRKVAAVAAFAAVLTVGAIFSAKLGQNPSAGVSVAERPVVEVEFSDSVSVVSAVKGPQLFLAEEVTDLSVLDLVDGREAQIRDIDASYLDAGVVPASFQPVSAGRAFDDGGDRIDSYLPPSGFPAFGRETTGSVIERRLGGQKETSGPGRSSSVLVSGYVTMGGAGSQRVSAEFRPVSISGNPVVNDDRDLRLYADLNGLRKELSEVIAGLPEGSEERAGLERALERSARVASELKTELYKR